VVLTEHDLAAARSHRLVPEGQAVLVPGVGIDLEHYRPTPPLLAAAAELRAELGLPEGRQLLTVVAALQPGKGHLTAVRALAASGLDAALACAGSGPRREAIAEEAARLGVADRVLLLGSVRDVRPLVLASAATVLPSHREGLSRAVMESLALGVPVLGSRIRGIADLVPVPDGGILLEPGDVDGLADAMRAASGFPGPVELRGRLEGHLQQYGLEAVLDRHVELYEELLLSRSSTTADTGVRSRQPSRWP
jgi:glycosyltransferase involved in cell wall biosynthesis